MQDPKDRQKSAIWAPSYNFVGRYPVVTAVQVTYALTTVVLHVGVAVDTGHYVTIVKRPADWLVCDEAQVGLQQIYGESLLSHTTVQQLSFKSVFKTFLNVLELYKMFMLLCVYMLYLCNLCTFICVLLTVTALLYHLYALEARC